MPLSDRVRPDSEAAPWVVKEIKKLEESVLQLQEENLQLKQTIHNIKKSLDEIAIQADGSLFLLHQNEIKTLSKKQN